MNHDPERLLAEALRAQARHAPAHARVPAHELPPMIETPGGYGLLSGAGEGSLERERAALEATEGAHRSARAGTAATTSLPLPWVLLLAVSLGLAAGSVVGLLTLL